ncbi:MAG: TadE/TadG family type IV pilus assembly protein [Sphingopyxis sp.]|nr:TadE/TadG family type IV pilus assembly protein [Sphingopyxis sp.]
MTHHVSIARRLCRNKRGTALIEFAMTAPVFLLLLMGVFDYCWQIYAQQVLQGAVSQAARLATLENNAGSQTAIDDRVRVRVKQVFKDADVSFKRLSYESYDQVGKPEPLTDKNGNGVWDTGECFEDMNGTGAWEADRGSAGNGGADDVVLYRASMKFDRVLPVWRMLGQPQETTLKATTVLRNQPYNANASSSQVICNK